MPNSRVAAFTAAKPSVVPNWSWVAGAILLAGSALVRAKLYPVATYDFIEFYQHWFDTLRETAGLTAFRSQFADYTPLYLYVVKILTFLPGNSLYLLKTLSVLFDIGVSLIVGELVAELAGGRRERVGLAVASILALPTVLLNSSLWAQIDASYTFALLACLLTCLRASPRSAAIWFGVAISFKLQAIFFAPVLGGFLLQRRALPEILWVPVVFCLTCVPALLAGAGVNNTLLIYVHQMNELKSLTLAAPSVFAFIVKLVYNPVLRDLASWFGIAAALAAGGVSALVAWRSARAPADLLLVALWCLTIVPFFLPRMHDRYWYPADIFAVVYAFHHPRRTYIPLLIVGGSLLAYMHYLSQAAPMFEALRFDLRVAASCMLAAVTLLSWWMWPLLRQASASLVIACRIAPIPPRGEAV